MYVLMCDTHTPIFNEPIIELSRLRSNFLDWVRFYYSHYFSLQDEEKPPEDLLEYDILFDDWLDKKAFEKKMHNEHRPRKSAEDMNEVIYFG